MPDVPSLLTVLVLVAGWACTGTSESIPDGASASDAAVALPDAPVSCDPAHPVAPPAADLVLGQADFLSGEANAGGESASSLSFPWGLAADGARLWVGDENNARVLQWNSLPTLNAAAADVVIGQATATAHVAGTSESTFNLASGLYAAVAAGRLLVTDSTNNRVLIWNGVPTANAPPADLVLGQLDFVTAGAGTGANHFALPKGVWTDGTRVVVVDSGNSRVLLWNTFPTTNGQNADLVLGWDDFGLGRFDPVAQPPTASSLNHPEGVDSDGERLYVSDSANHRVLVWSSFPVANGQPADVVLGQADASGYQANRGSDCPGAPTLSHPTGVTATADRLFVADTDNHRVLGYATLPVGTGQAATVVLGQPGLDTRELGAPAADRLNSPRAVLVIGASLFVSEPYTHRVVRFATDGF